MLQKYMRMKKKSDQLQLFNYDGNTLRILTAELHCGVFRTRFPFSMFHQFIR